MINIMKAIKIRLSLSFKTKMNRFVYNLSSIIGIRRIIPKHLYGNPVANTVFTMITWIISFFQGLFILVLYGGCFYFAPFFIHYNLKDIPTSGPLYRSSCILIFLIMGVLLGSLRNIRFFKDGYETIYLVDSIKMDAKLYATSTFISTVVLDVLKHSIMFLVFWALGFLRFSDIFLLLMILVAGRFLMSSLQIYTYYKTGKFCHEYTLPYWISNIVLSAALVAYLFSGVKIEVSTLALMIILLLLSLLSVGIYQAYYQKVNWYRSIQYFTRALNQGNMENIKVKAQLKSVEVKDRDVEVNKDIASLHGFRMFNTLFFERHKSYLRKPIEKISIATVGIFFVLAVVILFSKEAGDLYQDFIMKKMSLIMLLCYFLNRGNKLCSAMFFNCDASMLVYRFYRTPKNLLSNFLLRLKQLVTYHLLPGVTMATGVVVCLGFSGYKASILMYTSIFISILFMNLIFCIHSLILYYLLQPYNIEMEETGHLHRIVVMITYYVIYGLSQNSIPTEYFSVVIILFFILYSAIGAYLVYKIAPKTFKLR